MLLLNSNSDDDDDHKDSCPSSHVVNMPYAVLNTLGQWGKLRHEKVTLNTYPYTVCYKVHTRLTVIHKPVGKLPPYTVSSIGEKPPALAKHSKGQS